MTRNGNASLSIFDICSTIVQTDPKTGKAGRHSKPITEGLVPKKPSAKREGLHTLTPEEILAVRIERLSITEGAIVGYQRDAIIAHARMIARSMLRGRKIAPPTLALGEDGFLYASDGQHRLIAAVIARQPLRVVLEVLEQSERAERFADQSLSRRPSADVLILAKSDPVAAYLRAAIEAENQGLPHELAGFVGPRADRRRLGPSSAYDFLSAYALNVVGPGAANARTLAGISPDEALARVTVESLDTATRLLRVFGPKQQAHPDTYAPATLRALRDVAVHAVRRADDFEWAESRWLKLMPKFNWEKVPRTATRFVDRRLLLAQHWNSRLPADQKIRVVTN